MNCRQLARFNIDDRIIRDNPAEVAEIFILLKAVPIRAETLFHRRSIEYIAISERFEEVPDGAVVPDVELVVTKDDSGRVSLVEVVPV
jgi:hypothetical protein